MNFHAPLIPNTLTKSKKLKPNCHSVGQVKRDSSSGIINLSDLSEGQFENTYQKL